MSDSAIDIGRLRRVYPDIFEALEASDLPWSVSLGGRHIKLHIGPNLIGIMPRAGGIAAAGSRAGKNLMAQVRRGIKAASEAVS
jgi:hypothetical protein